MTLNEAIKQTEEKANLAWSDKDHSTHYYYSQLVDWLEELKQRRTMKKNLRVQDQTGGCLLKLDQIKSFHIEPCSELYLGQYGTEFDWRYPHGVTANHTIVAHINSKLKYYMGLYLWGEDAMRALDCLTTWANNPDKTIFVFPALEEMNPDLRKECC